MKTLLSVVLLFLATQCVAQTSGAAKPGTQRGAARHKLPGGERSMRGCLLKANDGYELQNTRGRKVKLGISEDLAPQVGHEVRLSGFFVDAPDPSDPGADSAGARGLSGSKTHRTVGREFQVIKVESLANACKTTSATRAR